MKDSYHVLPIGDKMEHLENTACWCKPRLTEGVVVHNAADNREVQEWWNENIASPTSYSETDEWGDKERKIIDDFKPPTRE